MAVVEEGGILATVFFVHDQSAIETMAAMSAMSMASAMPAVAVRQVNKTEVLSGMAQCKCSNDVGYRRGKFRLIRLEPSWRTSRLYPTRRTRNENHHLISRRGVHD